jgi:indolepyruvate ferredoxin oxidoreductase alpha subunit
MTGRQDNPGTGHSLSGATAPAVDIETICRALGVRDIQVIDPYDLELTRETLKSAMERPEPSVVIARRTCMLERRGAAERKLPLFVDADKCVSCKACLKIGCPAIEWNAEAGDKGKAVVNQLLCVGCGVCQQLCKFDAFGVRHEK